MAQTEGSTQTDKTNALCPLRTKEMNHEISREVAPEYYGSQSYGCLCYQLTYILERHNTAY